MKHELDCNKIVNILLDGKYIPDDMLLAFSCTIIHEFLRKELLEEETSENKYFYSSMRILLHQFREMLLPEYHTQFDEFYMMAVNNDESDE